MAKFLWQESLEPFFYLAHLVHSVFTLIFELTAPVFTVVWELIKIVLSLGKLFLYTPSMTMLKLLTILADGLIGTLNIIKDSLSFLKSLATPFSSQRSRQTTMSFLQVGQQIGLSWSQSIHKKVIQGAKAVYDFTVYVSGEVGKHRHSLQLQYNDLSFKMRNRVLSPMARRMVPSLRLAWRLSIWMVCMSLIAKGLKRLLEYSCGLDGIWWDDVLLHIHYFVAAFLSDLGSLLNTLLQQFHSFANWVSKEDNLDLEGIEL